MSRSALAAIFNPEDLNALEMALRVKEQHGGHVTLLTMGPPTAAEQLRYATKVGADAAIMITDKRFAAADTLATAYALGCAVNKVGPYHMILCGRQAIDGNTAANDGGGIRDRQFHVNLTSSTITANSAARAGGIFCNALYPDSSITNSIIWGNLAATASDLYLTAASQGTYSLPITYSCIARGADSTYIDPLFPVTWGAGVFDADPLFADAENSDCHLKSRHGRWEASASAGEGGWVLDAVTSPCINAGDPASDYSNQPQPSRRIEIGAYGNTPEASKGKWIIPGDVDGNGRVDVLDLLIIRSLLGQDADTGENWRADMNEDGRINVLDLIFARNKVGVMMNDE